MTSGYKTDVAIVGAGPTGLFAVFQCGMLGLRAHVVDAQNEAGGQCTALYPEKPIYDIPSQPEIAAGALIARLSAQAAPFAPHYHFGQDVQSLERHAEGWRLCTTKGVEITAKGVILATGGGAFVPHRPPIAGIECYENKSVFYTVRQKAAFAGQRIVIAGGGDSAVDWAVELADIASHIFVIHRRETFRAAPATTAKMYKAVQDGKITLVVPFQLKDIEGEAGQVTTVHVVDMGGQMRRIPADILLCFFGLSTQRGPLATCGAAIDPHGQFIVDQATCATSLPGLYAIGDCATYPAKLKLILTGFAEAAQAAHSLWHFVHPSMELHKEYSTSKGIPLVHQTASGVK